MDEQFGLDLQRPHRHKLTKQFRKAHQVFATELPLFEFWQLFERLHPSLFS